MDKPAPKLLQQFIREHLASTFRGAGFTGGGRRFTRNRGDLLDLVEIELWKENNASRARFTVSVGVCIPELLAELATFASFSYWQSALANPGLTECAVWERLGILMPEHQDRWWTVSSLVDLQALATEVDAAFGTYAVPWFDDLASVRSFATRDVEKPGIFDIAARARLGLENEARAARDAYSIQFAHLEARMLEISKKLLKESA